MYCRPKPSPFAELVYELQRCLKVPLCFLRVELAANFQSPQNFDPVCVETIFILLDLILHPIPVTTGQLCILDERSCLERTLELESESAAAKEDGIEEITENSFAVSSPRVALVGYTRFVRTKVLCTNGSVFGGAGLYSA